MIVQLKGAAATAYRGWLALYERVTGQFPTYRERTEAFTAATNGTRPYWHNWS